MIDFLLFVLLGLAVTTLSVWGGIVSVKSLGAGENKAVHIGGFITTGVVAFLLTVAVGVRNYITQRESAKQQAELGGSLATALSNEIKADRDLKTANDTLQRSRESEEYMKGQLNGLSLMVGKLGSDNSSGMTTIAKAINQVGFASAHATGIERSGIEKIPNKQLQAKVIEFANEMRQYASDSEKQDESRIFQFQNAMRTVTDKDQQARLNQQFRQSLIDEYIDRDREATQKFYTLAIMYRDELVRRLGPQPSTMDDNLYIWHTPQGNSSSYSLNSTANYLGNL
jgi:hypothetical protein